MDRKIFKNSFELLTEILEEPKASETMAQFASIWEEGDDDKIVIAKFRAYRAQLLSNVRFQLAVVEAATHQKLNSKK